MKKLKIILGVITALILLFFAVFYLSTYHPGQIDEVEYHSPDKDNYLIPGKEYKILTWNVQYMAGKKYNFYYDEWDGSGPDLRPSSEEITKTFNRVAEVIKDENPDIILLQEMDDDNYRTDFEDQTKRLLSLLPKEYKSYTTAWYWRAWFVPHPKIMDKVGVRLVIISKLSIEKATRHQLPLMPNNFIVENLQFKRAILEAHIPIKDREQPFIAMSTHLDAFAQGSNTMQQQVEYINNLLDSYNKENRNWVIAGDFNLLPPGESYNRLPEDEKQYFQEKTEMQVLYDKFNVLPNYKDIDNNPSKWHTHFANYNNKPDRTIDYIINSNNVKVTDAYVRNKDTLDISDHFPFIVKFTVK